MGIRKKSANTLNLQQVEIQKHKTLHVIMQDVYNVWCIVYKHDASDVLIRLYLAGASVNRGVEWCV